MIIHLAPHAPPALHALAGTALALHIGGASVALVAGPAALLVRKGGALHRAAGTAFFAGMLAMSAVGAIAAPLVPVPDPISSMAGAFTLYLTLTGWMALRRPSGGTGAFEMAGLVYALLVATAGAVIGQLGAASPGGRIGGEPFQIAYAFSAVALLAAALDLSVIWRGGLKGGRRIARHLWRMCLALFVALGSFAGQPKAQPDFLRGSPWLIAPALIVLAYMIFWLARGAMRRRPTTLAAAS